MLTLAQFIKQNLHVLLIYIVIFIIIALALSLLTPIEYATTSQVLIIHKLAPNLDAYSAGRASEKLAQDLVKIISTTSFIAALAESQKINIDTLLKGDEWQKRDEWHNKVSSTVNGSILEITTYDTDPQKAIFINNAIIRTLLIKGEDFHGGGQEIKLKMINAPLSSRSPVRPNFILNIILGIILGGTVAYWRLYRNFKKMDPAAK